MPTRPIDIPSPDQEYPILAALIAGAHGVGGNVRVRLIGSQPEVAVESLQSAKKIRLARSEDGFERDLTLTSLRRQMHAKGAWIAHFKEVSSRDEADLLYGCGLYVAEGQRPALADGEFYVDHLLGVNIVTDTGRDLGQLKDVLNTPAHDVYVTDKDVLIPAVAAFVLDVNMKDRKITIKDTPGLADDL